jgi:succinate dehydrogenase / fumarate reductase, cytochrome b subunit
MRASWLDSSIGQKIISAVTGLFLCAFLIVHLGGNLLLFKNDGGQAFNYYAGTMSHNIGIRILEIVLLAGFVLHIIWGIRVWLFDRRARPRGYVLNRPSENSSLASRIMFWSGTLVLIFLVIHLKTFWVPIRFPGGAAVSDYELVKNAFADPLYDGFYLLALLLLGYHLRQGFQSAFQTFGVRPLFRRKLDLIAVLFWLLIPIGFAAMPVFFLLRGGAK